MTQTTHGRDMGGAIETYTGRKVWPLQPHVDDVDIRDIAHSLAMQCRFNGHTSQYVSVAEHSVLLSRVVSDTLRLSALLHDGAEAYLSDIPRPTKKKLNGIEEVEDAWLEVLQAKFHAQLSPLPDQVKRADRRMCATEAFQFMPSQGEWWPKRHEPYDMKIEGWLPQIAERKFMRRFLELKENDE